MDRYLMEFGKRAGGGRRASAREVAPLTAVITTVSRSYTAILVNLSTTGARLRGDDLPPPGENFMFKIGAIRTFASIVWSAEDERGVTFESPLSHEDVERLRAEAGAPSLATMTLDERHALDDWITGKAR